MLIENYSTRRCCIKVLRSLILFFILKARMVINSLHLVHASSVREETQSENQKKPRY